MNDKHTLKREQGFIYESILMVIMGLTVLLIFGILSLPLITSTANNISHEQIASLGKSVENYTVAHPELPFPITQGVKLSECSEQYSIKGLEKVSDQNMTKITIENSVIKGDFTICIEHDDIFKSIELYTSSDGLVKDTKECPTPVR